MGAGTVADKPFAARFRRMNAASKPMTPAALMSALEREEQELAREITDLITKWEALEAEITSLLAD